ncbi:hypothetical protein [Paenibacillus senegalensis]|uniref:hypothetical protein n=1 Tax=Paenibacillus senegalensis TaxID=1465766 RepID=UPI000287FAE4|nr:hypothetical protein [Paenibacillus senegalensis]
MIKAAFAAFTSGIGLLLNSFIFLLYFGYPLQQVLVIFTIGLLFCLAWSALGVLLDVLHPKLDWVNRSEAVKQNKNVILAILLNAAILWGYYRFLAFAFSHNWKEPLILISIAVSISLLAAGAVLGIIIVSRRQERHCQQKIDFIEEGKS